MNVLEAITSRFSVRAFLETPVPDHLIETILEKARFAPSGVNTQPWRVAIVRGAVKQTLGNAIIEARQQQIPENPDYRYYPAEWFEPYKSRRKACGAALYQALNIGFEEKEKRLVAWNRNYHFFGAPVGMMFFIHHKLDKGSWLDMGLFLQNIMLAAREFDLATCPQASLAEYPDIVRNLLEVSNEYHVVCGMALGYPDMNTAVNQYRTVREPVANFTSWHG